MRSVDASSSIEDRINAEKAALLPKITDALGPNFSTVRAAKWMGRSRVHPLLLIRSGRLRAMKCGRVYIVAADDLATYLAGCYVEADAGAEAHRQWSAASERRPRRRTPRRTRNR